MILSEDAQSEGVGCTESRRQLFACSGGRTRLLVVYSLAPPQSLSSTVH